MAGARSQMNTEIAIAPDDSIGSGVKAGKGMEWFPVILLAAAALVFALVPVEWTWNSAILLLICNTVFLCVIALMVSILAAHSYLAGQSESVLLLGCGALALGLGAVLAGFPPGRTDPNFTATVYNSAALISSVFHLAGSALPHWRKRRAGKSGALPLMILYPAVALIVIIGAGEARRKVLPEFFMDGIGPTVLNRAILWISAGLFALSAAFLWFSYRRNRSVFARWYAAGLGSLTVGLVAVSIQTRFGGLLNWTGRATQYLAGIYLLIALILTVRRNQSWILGLEAALQQSEQRYQVLSEATVEGIGISENGRILDANEQLARLLGYTRQELIGMNVSYLLPPHERDRVMANIQTNVESTIEHQTLCKDGRILTVEAHAKALIYQGRPVRFTTIHDVTARKKAEEALRQTAAELKRSNEELEQFAYAASHDLQEPLRMISGFLQLLKDRYGERLDAKANEYIGYSIEGSMRMSQLIRDLLAYSRLERKGRVLQRTDASLPLTAALANLRNTIEEAEASVDSCELLAVMGDPVQLTQLFQNLIGNAVKFRSPDRKCLIRVGATRSGDFWEFSVRDNGIGINSKDFDRIFVIFQRLHPRSKYPGTGIGLALCKKIVEHHGGRMWLESVVGEGSVFRFTLMPATGTEAQKPYDGEIGPEPH